MVEIPKHNCEICGSNMHPTEEHTEMMDTGIEIVDVNKLIPEIKPTVRRRRQTDWRNYYTYPSTDITYSTAFSETLVLIDGWEREEGHRFFERFTDQVVVDLGAGYGAAYWLAAANNAKGYVGVDLWNYEMMHDLMADPLKRDEWTRKYKEQGLEVKPIPAAIMETDINEFLQGVPDNSVSIIVSGIDEEVVDRYYMQRMAEKIKRVLHPEGLCVINSSDIWAYLEKDLKSALPKDEAPSSFHLFVK